KVKGNMDFDDMVIDLLVIHFWCVSRQTIHMDTGNICCHYVRFVCSMAAQMQEWYKNPPIDNQFRDAQYAFIIHFSKLIIHSSTLSFSANSTLISKTLHGTHIDIRKYRLSPLVDKGWK